MEVIVMEFEDLDGIEITAGLFTLLRLEDFTCGVVTDAETGRRYLSIKLDGDDERLEQVFTFHDEFLEYIKDFIERKGL
jgi:hypothetical protein